MPLAETLIAVVAPAIAKTVLKLWAGDEKLASETGGAAIEALGKLIPGIRARNEANRQLAAIGEKAAASLDFIFETEGKTLLAGDQEAVAKLVAETLNRTKISVDLLVQKDLDPSQLAAHFLSEAGNQLDQLPEPRAELFRRVIEEASQSIIDIAHNLPNFSERTFAELLRRDQVLIDAAGRMLEGLERIRSQPQADQEAESAREWRSRSNYPVELGITYEEKRITGDRHDYELRIKLKNEGTKPIRDWHVDVEFPTRLLNPHTTYAAKVQDRSDDQISLFRATRSSDQFDIYPGDTKVVLSIPYYVDFTIHRDPRRAFDRKVEAIAYVQGERAAVAERAVRELKVF